MYFFNIEINFSSSKRNVLLLLRNDPVEDHFDFSC